MQLFRHKKGSALIITMLITMIIIIVAIYLLDKIVPYSRDVKGIENGNRAYYNAQSAIDEALLAMSGSNPGYQSGASSVYQGNGSAFSIVAMGKKMPPSGEGNSEYDKDWNKIGPGQPLQLVLPTGINWANVAVQFRVPDLNQDNLSNGETLSGTTLPIINWILSSSGNSLVATGSSYFLAANVQKSNSIPSNLYFTTRPGQSLLGAGDIFKNFYDSNCTISYKCTLKLSIINKLLLKIPADTYAPYLEYTLNITGSNPTFPLQYATIDTEGYSAGFRKDISKSVRQLTTSEVGDFTVFQ